jgi:uncharacterized protein YabN with tetrapyrrole methylase and pyrophosphatase domain
MMDEKQLYCIDILHYGQEHQLTIAIEEMSELTKELCKSIRGYDSRRSNIIEEVADVTIMLEQIKLIFNINDLEFLTAKNKKILRLYNMLEKEGVFSDL